MAEVTIEKSKLIPLVDTAEKALDKAGADVSAFPAFKQLEALERIHANLVCAKEALDRMRTL